MSHLTRLDDRARLDLSGEDIRIGRAPENDIVVADASVSRNHARIVRTDHGHLILDTGSGNGVLVNGARVTSHFLRAGDVIQLGTVSLRYEDTVSLQVPAVVQQQAPHRPVPATPQPPVLSPAAKATVAPFFAPPVAVGPGRSYARWILATLAILAVLALIPAYFAWRFLRGPQSKLVQKLKAGRSVATIVPELKELADVARVRVPPKTVQVGPGAIVVPVGDGAQLEIPAGAFLAPARLEISVVSVGLEHLDRGVRDSWAYVIRTKAEGVELKKTITLEIPYRPDVIKVAQLRGSTWQRLAVPPGNTTKVTIGHFSANIFLTAQSSIAVEDRPEWAGPTDTGIRTSGGEEWIRQQQREEERKKLLEQRKRDLIKRIEAGDEATRGFYGVGDQAVRSSEQNCSELAAVLDEFKSDPKNLALPASFENASCADLAWFLFENKVPSDDRNNYYWREVSGSLEEIKAKILASDRPLSMAQVLRISIQANGGNVPRGILAAHNLLKDVTHLGRLPKNSNQMPEDLGRIAAHLESWRHGSNVSPALEWDKMGPIYHLFAAATARAWCGAAMGATAVYGEAMLRSLGNMGDKVDSEKGDADFCGRELGALAANLAILADKRPIAPISWSFNPYPAPPETVPCPPDDPASWPRRLCPWSPQNAAIEKACEPGFCWDGGFIGSGACKPEKDIPNSYRSYTRDILCKDGFHMVKKECSNVPSSCEPD